MDCQLIGRWRIVEADLWDRAHLDLVEPAMMTIGAHGRGEITFGAMQGSLELEYSRSTVFFTWAGFEEMDEVSGSGSAELQDDGSLEIAFAYHRHEHQRLVRHLPLGLGLLDVAGLQRRHRADRVLRLLLDPRHGAAVARRSVRLPAPMERAACAHGQCATHNAAVDRYGRGRLPEGVATGSRPRRGWRRSWPGSSQLWSLAEHRPAVPRVLAGAGAGDDAARARRLVDPLGTPDWHMLERVWNRRPER